MPQQPRSAQLASSQQLARTCVSLHRRHSRLEHLQGLLTQASLPAPPTPNMARLEVLLASHAMASSLVTLTNKAKTHLVHQESTLLRPPMLVSRALLRQARTYLSQRLTLEQLIAQQVSCAATKLLQILMTRLTNVSSARILKSA